MEGAGLVTGITAVALALAAQVEDVSDISVLGAAFTQLGDTLSTIAAERGRLAAIEEKVEARKKAAEKDGGASV